MPGDKFLDVAEQRFGIAGPEGVVAVGILNILGAGDLRCQTPTQYHRGHGVRAPVEDKGRNAHARKDRSYVDLRIQYCKCLEGSRAS
jgi:hypothetical protein